MYIKLILCFILVFSFLYASESYPDYYNMVIKHRVIHTHRRDQTKLTNKLIDGQIGLSLSYNYLFASKFKDIDPALTYGLSYKKFFSKFDYLQLNLFYSEYSGKMFDVKANNKLYMIEAIYLIKPPLWSLPVYLGLGPGFVYNQPELSFQDSDKSGVFLSFYSVYRMSNKSDLFFSVSKSTLKDSDFKENISIGLNYFFY